jgi:hypothetical protein
MAQHYRFDHLRQRFGDLVLRIVEIPQLVFEQGVQRDYLRHEHFLCQPTGRSVELRMSAVHIPTGCDDNRFSVHDRPLTPFVSYR